MIKETYCSCELVRLIKEKGVVIAEHTKYIPMLNADCTTTPIATITHQTAIRWLRDNHDIHIGVTRGYDKYFIEIVKMHPYRDFTPKDDDFDDYYKAIETALKFALEII